MALNEYTGMSNLSILKTMNSYMKMIPEPHVYRRKHYGIKLEAKLIKIVKVRETPMKTSKSSGILVKRVVKSTKPSQDHLDSTDYHSSSCCFTMANRNESKITKKNSKILKSKLLQKINSYNPVVRFLPKLKKNVNRCMKTSLDLNDIPIRPWDY